MAGITLTSSSQPGVQSQMSPSQPALTLHTDQSNHNLIQPKIYKELDSGS